MPHIVIAVTSPLTATLLLRGQLRYLQESNWQVTLLCGPGSGLEQFAEEQGVELVVVPMKREPSPLADLKAVKTIYSELQKLRPDVISYGTPKASLLCSIASYLSGIQRRIYVLRGLRAEGLKGAARLFALLLERLTSSLSTQVFCVSESLKQSAIDCWAVSGSKAQVIGRGGSNGVDTSHFQVTPETSQLAQQLKLSLHIPADAKVVGFVGRMVKDKGIRELMSAFDEISLTCDCYLLLVGRREQGDDLPVQCWEQIEKNPRICWLGERSDLSTIYPMMDVFVLPSYREGLPNVVLEASSMERPVVVSRVTGAKDAVADGETGTLFELGSHTDLVNCISRYLYDPELRTVHGKGGRQMVIKYFSNQAVWQAYEAAYKSSLENAIG